MSKYFVKPDTEDRKENCKNGENDVRNKGGKKDPTNPCVICLQTITDIGRIACKHEFCVSCIKQWASNSNTCPLCKARFNFIKRVTVVRRGRGSSRKTLHEKLDIVHKVKDKDQVTQDTSDQFLGTEWSALEMSGYLSDNGFVVGDDVVESLPSASEDVLQDEDEILGGYHYNRKSKRRKINFELSSSDESDCNPFDPL